MCLALPLQIESIGEGGAVAALNDSRTNVDLTMTPEAKVGDWILVHAGFAIAVLDAEQARQTFDVLRTDDE
jgi:hydrogenase expression/formation protein HypC